MICDTDVMIDYWDTTNSRHSATKKILEENIELGNVVLSAITKMELQLGAINKSDMQKIRMKLSRFDIALLNNDITLKSFKLIENYSLSHGLTLPDGLIAATALVADLEFFTYNKKDFKFIPNLKLYGP